MADAGERYPTVSNVRTGYRTGVETVEAVGSAGSSVPKGRLVAILGPSGCGKIEHSNAPAAGCRATRDVVVPEVVAS